MGKAAAAKTRIELPKNWHADSRMLQKGQMIGEDEMRARQ